MEEPVVKPRIKLMAMYYCGECIGNAEQSAIKAGYSPRYARGNAYKIVASSGFQAYLKYLEYVTRGNRDILTIEGIKEFWSKVVRNPAEETKDRLRASELLAKANGMFRENW